MEFSGKMSFISLFKNRAFWITVAIFAAVEIVVRILPSHYGEGAGVFLTNHRKILAESETPEFDYILLGDSRSLSVMGHIPTDEEPYSLYNFSLPAMDSRYYKFFLEKILENRKHRPVAVIFSADPQVFFRGYNAPLNDPKRKYTDSPQTTISQYVWNRVVRRVLSIFRNDEEKIPEGGITTDMLWEHFSHRYLHLFDFSDIIRNYTGAERVFLIKESLPLLYSTYKYRNSVSGLTDNLKSVFRKTDPVPDYCGTCEGLVRPECHHRLSHLEDNSLISDGLRERYGQINLADRLTMTERLGYLAVRDSQIKRYKKRLNEATPDLSFMEDFVKFAISMGLKVIVTDVPAIDEYEDTKFHRTYYPAVEKMLSKYPEATIIRFPEPYYPADLFVEQVHYDCRGADMLNRDFYTSVMPEILKFAPPIDDNRKRSFDMDEN